MPIVPKTPEEIEKMRVAGRLAAEVLAMLKEHVKPGVTTEDLDRIAHDHIVNVQHAIPANVGYRGYPKTLCTSVNQVICHGIPSPGKVLKDGDIGDIGHAIQKHAEAAGFSVVREYCGHGIGKIYHDDPQILHYGKPGTGMRLEKGMTFTIEPMINAGKPGTRQLPDGWTVVTRDHSLSAQWEHTVAVTDDGFEILTPWPDA